MLSYREAHRDKNKELATAGYKILKIYQGTKSVTQFICFQNIALWRF